jgi:PhoH-like ATPase
MTKYANVPDNGTSGKQPKIFVLDTNIILHDFKAIRHFQDNDLVIPMAVIEELDKFKKGNDTLSFNARGFMREINKLTDGKMFGKSGVPIGHGLGFIKIEPNHPFSEQFKDLFHDDIQDHRILATAMWVRDNNPGRFVALVTKDINLRLKAKAAGMEVQDYLTDRIEDNHVEGAEREVEIIDNLSSNILQKLAYGQDTAINWKEVSQKEPKPNQLYKFKWDKQEGTPLVCARYDSSRGQIVLVKERTAYGISPRNDEQKFALDACLNPKIQLVSLTGGAGTGKTLIALASALEQEKDFDQIILTRPTVILGNQDIGFLPGDANTKMGPFLQPLMDNLNVIKACFRPTSKEAMKIEGLLKDEKLLITPLAYIRGRSLGKAFFIIDEAQNLTPLEIKTIITRAGEGTKLVFTGDIFQIDQPYLDQWSNGVTHLDEKMDGQKMFEHIFLRKGERSELSEIASKLL